MKIIGIAGTAGAGKSTAADVLVAEYGFTKLSLAGPLKDAVQSIYGLTDEQVFGSQKEVIDTRYNMTARTILQKFGTEVGRSVYENTWTDALHRQLTDTNGRYVIDDVRFPNEADAIRKWGGNLLFVKRPGYNSDTIDSSHASEQVSDITFTADDDIIDNDDTLDKFTVMVRTAYDNRKLGQSIFHTRHNETQKSIELPPLHAKVSWSEYFFNIAAGVAKRSTCPRADVGAILVTPDNRIILTGYNGAPEGEVECVDEGCIIENSHCIRVIHAEQNIITYAARSGIPTEGNDIYVWFNRKTSENFKLEDSREQFVDISAFPCQPCRLNLIGAGIRRVIVVEAQETDASQTYTNERYV